MYHDPILRDQIKRDEGRSAVVYRDSEGLWTIGDGILVDFRVPGAGLLPEEMDFILDNRLGIAARAAMNLIGASAWAHLSPVRRRVLINMCYNLGANGLSKFQRMLGAVVLGDYSAAAKHMKDSKWYTQVGQRAKRLCLMMETGEDQ